MPYVCPWWGGYFIDNRFRRWIHHPHKILHPYVHSGMRVLDFGCGMGFFSIAMAHLVGDDGQVIAVDLQQQMLDVLMRRAAKVGVAARIRAHCCQATMLEFDEPVDFVLAFYSVHEAPDHQRLLTDIHRCLQDDGRFLVVEPVGHVSASAFEKLISTADAIGFTLSDRPRILLSRAAVLVKA